MSKRYPSLSYRSFLNHVCAGVAIATWILLPALPLALPAQDLGGEYLLAVDGNPILSLTLRAERGGRLTGLVSAAGKTVPLSGVIRGGGAVFISSAPDGSRLHWEAYPQGAGLAVVMAPAGVDGKPDAALAQRHVLIRGRPGSGGLRRSSQQWIGRLSAAADSIVSWCSSPLYASSDLCLNAMQVLRKVAPALMVARFATGGQATSLMRVLAQGPGSNQGLMAQQMETGDDSFLSAIEPPPDDVGEVLPPPDDYYDPPPVEPSPVVEQPVATQSPGLAQMLLGGGAAATAPAVSVVGEYVMLHAGSELLRVRFADDGGGALKGTLTLMGTPFPLSGTSANNAVSFSTHAPSGEVGRWEGVIEGERLALTLTTSSGTERYDLMRHGAGWSDAAPLAREWDAALRGKTVAHSAGARDPASGAVAETLLHFCADGTLRMQVGARAGNEQPAWRVVANNEQAAVELQAPEGTIQVGLHRQGTAITFAGQPARIVGSSSACR